MGEQNIKWVGFRRSLRVLWKKARVVIPIALVCAVFVFLNHFSLSVQLEGASTIYLEYGESYRDPGAVVMLSSALLGQESIPLSFIKVETVGDVSEGILGRYNVTYTASVLWYKVSADRQVCIVDTVCPEITFTKDYFGTPQEGESRIMHGIRAVDNYDGDITDHVICTRTAGWVTYSVVDSSGNPAYVVREVPESAYQPPQIILEGGEAYTIPVGLEYAEPGFTAKDFLDSDLTKQVLVEGEVNPLVPGVYPVTYSVADQDGRTATVTRQVTVEAKARPDIQWPQEKTVYLTFDDGPGPETARLLKVLERYGVRATFFVTDSGYDSLMQDIVKGGHSIGIHTVTHDYGQIYSSPEAYFTDLQGMQEIIYQNTGVMTTLMRFPGGGSNLVSRKTNKGLMSFLTEAVQDAGYQYFDWNVDSDDAGNAKKRETVLKNVIEGIQQQEISIVLQHDIHSYSVDAVEEIIQWGLENGYTFRPLTDRSPGFHHGIQN